MLENKSELYSSLPCICYSPLFTISLTSWRYSVYPVFSAEEILPWRNTNSHHASLCVPAQDIQTKAGLTLLSICAFTTLFFCS